MSQHFDDTELERIICGEGLGKSRRDHLQNCLSCRRKVDEFSRLIERAGEEMEGEMPEWDLQLRQILQQIGRGSELTPALSMPRAGRVGAITGRYRRIRTSLMLAAATLLVLIGGIRMRAAREEMPHPTPRPELTIEEILATTDSLLADTSIPGFEGLDTIDNNDLDLVFDNQNS